MISPGQEFWTQETQLTILRRSSHKSERFVALLAIHQRRARGRAQQSHWFQGHRPSRHRASEGPVAGLVVEPGQVIGGCLRPLRRAFSRFGNDLTGGRTTQHSVLIGNGVGRAGGTCRHTPGSTTQAPTRKPPTPSTLCPAERLASPQADPHHRHPAGRKNANGRERTAGRPGQERQADTERSSAQPQPTCATPRRGWARKQPTPRPRRSPSRCSPSGWPWTTPLTLRHRDGHEPLTEVLYNASVYRDAAGKVLGVSAAARDVTEQMADPQRSCRAAGRARTVPTDDRRT